MSSKCKDCFHSEVCRYASIRCDFEEDMMKAFNERVMKLDKKDMFTYAFVCKHFSRRPFDTQTYCSAREMLAVTDEDGFPVT